MMALWRLTAKTGKYGIFAARLFHETLYRNRHSKSFTGAEAMASFELSAD